MGMDPVAGISAEPISDLEEAALGILQSRRDVVAVRAYNKIRAAAILVRPGNTGGNTRYALFLAELTGVAGATCTRHRCRWKLY